MRDPVSQALLLTAALACSTAGLAWLALAMETHWHQVHGERPLPRAAAITLRLLGSAALLASLLICLRVDHASMAALVWVMAMAAAALIVAFTLSWRPRCLAPLAAWARPRNARSGSADLPAP